MKRNTTKEDSEENSQFEVRNSKLEEEFCGLIPFQIFELRFRILLSYQRGTLASFSFCSEVNYGKGDTDKSPLSRTLELANLFSGFYLNHDIIRSNINRITLS